MEELKKIWDKSNLNERLEIVYNQINTWLPIQYHNFEFIEQMYDELPEPVRNWLVKYYLKN
jgi:hypothetical protein